MLTRTAGVTLLSVLFDMSSAVIDLRRSFVSELHALLEPVNSESRGLPNDGNGSLFFIPLKCQFRSFRLRSPRAGIVRNVSFDARRLVCDDNVALRPVLLYQTIVVLSEYDEYIKRFQLNAHSAKTQA